MNGVSMMLASEFNLSADEAGALVIYPNSRGPRWMYLDEDETPADEDYHDDIAFLRALIDHLSGQYAVDSSRIYVAGYSSGGLMTLRLRCEMPDRIAAFAVIAANFSYDLALHCLDSEPAPVVVVIGTRDTPFPMLGFAAVTPSGELDSVFSLNQEMTFLSTLNECAQDVTEADVSSPTGTVQILRHTYPTCANNTQLKLYALLDWDHDWPGRAPLILEQSGEEGTIREAIWEFFAAFRLPDTTP
jgi:polyhydroxybutyrate depolymerase